ncbi:unnamed protein product [Meloidogyne enterolobii]|uniref:Uncharacterized protein n=1 Tax=Meloidogyne enterolobii TaxID=390850 RepID=A0ACB1A0K5_MELEN
MLNDYQRKEIVDLVEQFKEKTKLPNSTFPCAKEGLRLIVALAEVIIANVCKNGGWTSSNPTSCESKVLGIELNTGAFHYCYSAHWLMNIHNEEFERLANAEKHRLNNRNYFDVLKNYIENLRILYINRYSIFDNYDRPFQDTREKLSKIQQSLEQGNQTLLNSQAAIEERETTSWMIKAGVC